MIIKHVVPCPYSHRTLRLPVSTPLEIHYDQITQSAHNHAPIHLHSGDHCALCWGCICKNGQGKAHVLVQGIKF